ncbi:hypothetical protein Esi_0486_0021 [Ectocarpus siliculosus]|uniref:Uncharacterized protein n=1 Tax=Ectocarpus siliculosus TaxID=2880 RepID=D8LNJ9_ECTSI|nr:hypothetical protein Esi_0486_0021 [Ectocarpus siliculosus]|eukprot:CBN76280.1 hypothetical protein Esi_0486_0021 [Ectocarpus siliculosus]
MFTNGYPRPGGADLCLGRLSRVSFGFRGFAIRERGNSTGRPVYLHGPGSRQCRVNPPLHERTEHGEVLRSFVEARPSRGTFGQDLFIVTGYIYYAGYRNKKSPLR